MAQRRLHTVSAEFLRSLRECKQLSADAYRLSLPGSPGARPMISQKRRDQMTEMAFLRAFLAWETFIEESFILYLYGQKPPRGRAPRRYAFPPDFKTAKEWVVPEGRPYAQWTTAEHVSRRAERFFQAGRPFSPVLKSNQNLLDEVRTIRNAIAHHSESTQQKFDTLVRTKLGTLPPNLTVGGFLGTTVPNSIPPVSFLEFYVAKIDLAAQQIVPS